MRLKIQTRKKVGLMAIFLLGLFTTVCSILRYLQINRIEYGDGNSTMLVLWGTVEFNVGVSNSSKPHVAAGRCVDPIDARYRISFPRCPS